MPDKKNESKFMAMLERKGIVTKVDSADNTIEPSPEKNEAAEKIELSSMFGHPNVKTQDAQFAPRQPVPGIITPTLPADNKPDENQTQQRPPERIVPIQTPTEQQPTAQAVPAQTPTESTTINKEPVPIETGQVDFNNSKTIQISKDISKEVTSEEMPQGVDVMYTPYKAEGAQESPLQSIGTETPPVRETPVDRTTERYLDINEIYASLSLSSKHTDTIYLIEEYMKTLPGSLPEESRREIVNKIVAASGFDYDMLMGDGVLRVKMIKDYAEKFARYTEEYVAGQNVELEELERQMQRVKTLIENRRELHRRQFFTIEAEAQRLKEILLFISG